MPTRIKIKLKLSRKREHALDIVSDSSGSFLRATDST